MQLPVTAPPTYSTVCSRAVGEAGMRKAEKVIIDTALNELKKRVEG